MPIKWIKSTVIGIDKPLDKTLSDSIYTTSIHRVAFAVKLH